MKESSIIGWKTEKEFRDNAYRFYQKCKNNIIMPYSEEIFIETICAIFAVMRKGQKPNLKFFEGNAINAIIAKHQEMPASEIRTEIRKMLKGEEIGDALYGRWFELCCKFRRKAKREYYSWNEYCKKIAEKERKILAQHRQFTAIQRDILHVILTIELL